MSTTVSTTAATSASTPSIDLARLIDGRPLSGLQWRAILLAMTIVILDGFDLQAVGVAGPAIANAWGLSPRELAPAFAAAPFGMMIGAFIFGPLGDRYGRKRMGVLATLLMGVGALLSAFVMNLPQLIGARFVTGLGLGGVLPMLIALVTEYAPRRLNGRLMMLSFGFLPFGSMLAGLVGAGVIANFGWPALFVIGGIAPIAVALLAAVMLPESARYLVARAERGEEVLAIAQRIAPDQRFGAGTRFSVPDPPARRAWLASLFGRHRTLCTLLLIVLFAMNMFLVNFSVNWMPTLFGAAGLSAEAAIASSALLNFGGVAGAILWGVLLDRFGPYRVMAGAGLACAAAFGVLSLGHWQPLALGVTLFVVGGCILGAMPGIYALIASVYPTPIRSTGVGTVLGFGRIGSVAGPLIGGWLLGLALPVPSIFLIMTIPGVLLAIAVALLSRAPRGFDAS